MEIRERKRLCKIAKELCYLTEEDREYLMDPENSEADCIRRMITMRHREEAKVKKRA